MFCVVIICITSVRISFFFVKQKTAYEMRISDWSSYVCSSDLLRREGFVEFDEVDVVPAETAAREQPFDRGDGADAHAAGVAARRRRAVIPGDGREAEFVELVLGDDEAGGGGVILLARIARGDDGARNRLGLERAQLAEGFQRGV